MRDPRLVEIDFLADLERSTVGAASAQPFFICGKLGEKIHGGPKRSCYGADASHFREMVIDLIGRGLVVGQAIRTPNATINDETLQVEARTLANDFANGYPQIVIISHAGRVHLWNLRDALLRDPELEPLAGLRNRAAWDRALSVLSRFATSTEPLSVILLALNDFGAINKSLGMPVGDAVLRASFTLMKNLIGTRGTVYRCGGEEVGVLLPNTAQSQAALIAEELRSMVEIEVSRQVTQLTGPQTVSVGVKAFTAPDENDSIVNEVDELMRAAKTAGKNRVHEAP